MIDNSTDSGLRLLVGPCVVAVSSITGASGPDLVWKLAVLVEHLPSQPVHRVAITS